MARAMFKKKLKSFWQGARAQQSCTRAFWQGLFVLGKLYKNQTLLAKVF